MILGEMQQTGTQISLVQVLVMVQQGKWNSNFFGQSAGNGAKMLITLKFIGSECWARSNWCI
jgi:hypothetical protein